MPKKKPAPKPVIAFRLSESARKKLDRLVRKWGKHGYTRTDVVELAIAELRE